MFKLLSHHDRVNEDKPSQHQYSFTHQEAMLLLRYCSLPRLTHLMRTLRPQHLTKLSHEFDGLILSVINNRFGINIPHDQHNVLYRMLTLPLSYGGIGFRSNESLLPISGHLWYIHFS